MRNLDTKQKIFMSIMFALTGIATLVIFFVIYNIIEKEKPWTMGVTYASMIEVDGTKEPILKVSIKSNKNKNGEAIYDMQFNSYSDTEGNGITGFGIQCIGDWKVLNNSGYKDYAYSVNGFTASSYFNGLKDQYAGAHVFGQSVGFGKFYFYYTGDNGQVYHTLSKEKIENYVLISIGESFYKVELKEYSCEVKNDDFWAFMPWVPDTKTIQTRFSWLEIFDVVMRSANVTNVSTTHEEFDLSLFDLSDFITISSKNDKGQYESIAKTTETKNYFNISVDYSLDGANTVADSMFGLVANSPTWATDNVKETEKYWNAYADVILTENHVNYVYNETESAYYITIDEKFSQYLNSLGNAEISIDLDLTSLDFDVYGIDLKHFNFKLKSFEILANSTEDFKLYNTTSCSLTPTLKAV